MVDHPPSIWLVLLAAGCAGAADDSAVAPCVEGETCCAVALPTLAVCVVDLPAGESVPGTFTSWKNGGTFTADSGEVYDVWVDGDGVDEVPDLGAAGPVVVEQTGSCDGKSGIHTAVLVTGSTGDTLLLSGSAEIESLGGWSVQVPNSGTDCAPRTGDMCNELLTDRPLEVRHTVDVGGQQQTTAVVVDMGEETTLDGYTVRVNLSQSGSGAYLCADGGGSEYTNFWVIGSG